MMMSVNYNVNVFNVHVLLCGDVSYLLAGGKCLSAPSPWFTPHWNFFYLAASTLYKISLFAYFVVVIEFVVCTNVVGLKSDWEMCVLCELCYRLEMTRCLKLPAFFCSFTHAYWGIITSTTEVMSQGPHYLTIMKPPLNLPLKMAEWQ